MIRSTYLAAPGFEAKLVEELTRREVTIDRWHGLMALSRDEPVRAAWALDAWTAPVEIPVPSIKAGADALRAMQRNWAVHAVKHFRRMTLIGERLPPVHVRPLIFPAAAPTSHLGGWTLLSPDLMLASPTKTSPFVNGECQFEEDRIAPPSRAYLKLWEALARLRKWPEIGRAHV